MLGTGSRVGIAVCFEEGAQLGAVTVDGVSHHPGDGHARRLGALEHPFRQCGFGLKGDCLGDMGGEAAGRVSAPVLGQVQLAINEAVALCRDIGEEHADLAVFDAPGAAAILRLDTGGVVAAFGKATFIQDPHGQGRRRLSRFAGRGRRAERLAEEGAQFIAHPVVIPDGLREQTLHAVGSEFFGMLSDLPAIFPGDVTDDGLQVAQGTTAWLGARKTGRQARMQMQQAHGPGANLAQGWLGWLWCGIIRMLHAFLVANGQLKQEVFVLLECHIGAYIARSFLCFRENSRENGSLYKCHCSGMLPLGGLVAIGLNGLWSPFVDENQGR